MGILAIGVSFGAPIALSGVLLHVLAHAAAKGNAFMGAGVLVRKFGTKELARMANGVGVLPWSGPLFLAAVLALSAMPPFGLFRSEFQIVAGGFAHPRNIAAATLVCLVTLAFLGLTIATTRILFQPSVVDPTAAEPAQIPSEPSRWMVAPVVAGVVVLLVLGLAPPSDLVNLLNHGASELAVGVR
jgi:hydrogenase-4 component F